MPENIRLTVPRQAHGQRIDTVLATLRPDFSRTQLSTWLKQGKIIIDGRHFKPKDAVFGGEQIDLTEALISIENKVKSSQPEAIPLCIIYEDEHLLVLNKPSGLIVHPGAGNPEHTLVNALLYHDSTLQQLPRAGIIHRLDKDTTGLLLVAKTLVSYTNLIRQMQERLIQRHYLALVQGHVISSGKIDTCFGRHPKNRLKMSVLENGRQAITHYTVKKRYLNYTLLNVQLLTGRTHQIRVHMAHLNHSVVGDPLYGGRLRLSANLPPHIRAILQAFTRQALHAITLSFLHPKQHRHISLEAPLPDDFKCLLDALGDFK